MTTTLNASTRPKRRHRDQYEIAQAKRIREANISRQTQLREQRAASAGDPIRGTSTPFIESLDSVGNSTVILDAHTSSHDTEDGKPAEMHFPDNVVLDHFLSPKELQEGIKHSYMLTVPQNWSKNREFVDPAVEAAELKEHAELHARATTALTRITSLANASQKGKTAANVRRCIDTFGRHNTDETYTPKPALNMDVIKGPLPEKTPRAGPDTGSSEVQIAILTAKIKVLADQLDAKGTKDYVGKRDLRLLVHRRQKLLNYLKRKERGSDRWKVLVETLGLGEATYKGEIAF
jgi:ribosomal protein S15